MDYPDGIEVLGPIEDRFEEILTGPALEFVAGLHRRFNPTRLERLAARKDRQARIDAGEMPDFLEATRSIREGDWRIAPEPDDLQNRHVEITGPVDRKMMINALNSGARVFMADFEDANSPTWFNVIQGQVNLWDAVERTIAFDDPASGKQYRLGDSIATLMVRPRGWHLHEKHVLVDGEPISASLFDFGLYLFHNGRRLVERGTGPYFYLPKLESHLEARLWNDVFVSAQEQVGLPVGTIKATVLIETVLAAFEMEEILYELRDHSAGLNAGRWDYIFSIIKKFRTRPDLTLPDRSQVTMTVPFMRAYTEQLVRACHRRHAHAMGGMAAFIPNRRDMEVTEVALAKVKEDKVREAGDGFDGTWVAHPDLVPTAAEVFDGFLGDKANQVEKLREDVHITAADLLNTAVEGGKITEAGIRLNVNVGIQYLESWLRGTGAAAIANLMEDAATAEISRSQIWQWVHNKAQTDDGSTVTPDLVRKITDQELDKIREAYGDDLYARGRWADARTLFEKVALDPDFHEFLTLPAYEMID